MELTRPSFAHYPFRWPPRARRDICGRGAPPMGFTPENRFGAGARRGFYWSQRQAGLAIQPLFSLGFRLRWSGRRWRKLSVFGYGLAARARVLSVLTRVLSVLTRVLSVLAYVLPVLTSVLPVLTSVLPACVHGFKGIGADWGVWEAQSPCFSPLPVVFFVALSGLSYN